MSHNSKKIIANVLCSFLLTGSFVEMSLGADVDLERPRIVSKKRPHPQFQADDDTTILPIPFAGVDAEEQVEDILIEEDELALLPRDLNRKSKSFLDFTPRRELKSRILNGALYKDAKTKSVPSRKRASDKEEASDSDDQPGDVGVELGARILDLVSPDKMAAYREAGGDSPSLRTDIIVLKAQYPYSIQNLRDFPRNDEYPLSPSIRTLADRRVIAAAREEGGVRPLPVFAFVEPLLPETPEERVARKLKQKEDFKAAELKRGIIPSDLEAELKSELTLWNTYLSYVQLKKDEVLLNGAKKMRWPDLVGAFLKYIAPYMTRVIVKDYEDYEFYFFPTTLKFDRPHPEAGVNHKAMGLGYTPIGADGQRMNYHHLTQFDPFVHKIKIDEETRAQHEGPYKIVLITQWLHQIYSGALHPDGDTYVSSHIQINRPAFDNAREEANKTIVAQYPTK